MTVDKAGQQGHSAGIEQSRARGSERTDFGIGADRKIRSPAIATASALGSLGSTVWTMALNTTKSGSARDAARGSTSGGESKRAQAPARNRLRR
ncbi:MAG: hypothetical protein IPF48_08265 [Sphingomonadales bacterium]|nr:hypothetical protein [Sphingomonadales bacterium]